MRNANQELQDVRLQLEQFFTSRETSLWTAMPAIVQQFDPVAMTVDATPSIKGKQVLEDGTVQLVTMPTLLDCPVVFPHGGGASITFPIKPGDECLVVFASRDIDLWWQNGGIQPPQELRMHDLSDGFAVLGVYSQPKRLSAVSTSAVQLRSDDGAAFFELNPSTHNFTLNTSGNFFATVNDYTVNAQSVTISAQTIEFTASTFTVNAPSISLNGQISGGGSSGATASFTGGLEVAKDVTAGSISLQHHTHTGDSGGDTSAPK